MKNDVTTVLRILVIFSYLLLKKIFFIGREKCVFWQMFFSPFHWREWRISRLVLVPTNTRRWRRTIIIIGVHFSSKHQHVRLSPLLPLCPIAETNGAPFFFPPFPHSNEKEVERNGVRDNCAACPLCCTHTTAECVRGTFPRIGVGMGGRNMKSPFTPLLLRTTLTFILRGNYRVVVVPTTGSFFFSPRGNYEPHFLGSSLPVYHP